MAKGESLKRVRVKNAREKSIKTYNFIKNPWKILCLLFETRANIEEKGRVNGNETRKI